jgi:hypothetical protein
VAAVSGPLVAPPRAAAQRSQRSRRGAWFGVAACITSLAGAAVCEGKPTVAQVDGYTITLPPGWDTNAESGDGVTFASLDSFADDVECQLQVYSMPFERDAFMRIAHNSMSATAVAPAALETGLGRFEGTTFTGKIPADSTIGKLAQLAGTPHGEAYFGGPAEKPIGVFIMTFASDDAATRKRLRDKCANAIASLRLSP